VRSRAKISAVSATVLFNAGDLHSQIESWGTQLRDEISRYSADALLNASVDSLVEYFVAGFSINAIELDTEGISVEQDEVDIDIRHNPAYVVFDRSRPAMRRGTKFQFHVPFTGDAGLFGMRPSTFTLSGIAARIYGQELIFEVRQLEPDPAAARSEFERNLAATRQMVACQRDQIDAYHRQLPETSRSLVEARRTKLLADRLAVASLGYPMRVRDDTTTFSTSIVAQRPKIAARTDPPPGGTKPFVPEPVLTDEDYGRVLAVVRSLTRVMERSPSAFVRSTEETLRDHILVQLNGHFDGKAVGEAFNASGKTDILLRDADKNLLICECKFWTGAKSLTDAVDQLMSYLTWRDAKALLVVFNRTTRMATVLKAIEQGIPEHLLYRRGFRSSGEAEFECVLQRTDDPDREVRLTVMVMDVPSDKPTRRSKEAPTA